MVGQIRVLLADDEKAFLDSLVKVLSRRGIAARTAYDGRAALEVLSHEQFDVIVLDVRMPVMDGLAALREIRRTDTLTPVLLLSGQADLGYVGEAMKGGAADYLLKPCDIDTLISAIENAHERKKIRMEVAQESPKKQPRSK
ncbi:response regulator [Candidatus Poribacteria bacterium]|nr:response regulator [Candidatus Poribacteria bacterium]